MGLYMYYFVRNRGSWRLIRRDLDQILLTHVVSFMLLGCICLAKIFMANTTMEKVDREDARSSRRTASPEETEA